MDLSTIIVYYLIPYCLLAYFLGWGLLRFYDPFEFAERPVLNTFLFAISPASIYAMAYKVVRNALA